MKRAWLPFSIACSLFAQQMPDIGTALWKSNDYASMSRALSNQGGRPRVTVFPGDLVVPQFVNGSSWSTTISLINLSTSAEGFSLLFVTEGGGPLRVPIVGLGNVVMIGGKLNPGQCISYETDGTGPLQQGWALLLPDSFTTVRIAGFAVFRQRIANRPDFEAVVPIGSVADTKFVVMYDNTHGFSTGVALVNPDPDNAITVTAAFRDDAGGVYLNSMFTMQPMSHVAFSLPDRFPATAGREGSVLLSSSGRALSGLGLRFNPSGAFTSFHILNTLDMID